jgi:hypothetical protein
MARSRAKSMPVARERDVSRAMVRYLQSLGYAVHRRNVGAMEATCGGRTRRVRFAEPGASDYWLVLRDGRHCEVEVKRPGKKPNKHQILWMLRMNMAGAAAFWADNVGTLATTVAALEVSFHIYMYQDGTFDLAPDPDVARSQAQGTLIRLAGELCGGPDVALARAGRAALREVGP